VPIRLPAGKRSADMAAFSGGCSLNISLSFSTVVEEWRLSGWQFVFNVRFYREKRLLQHFQAVFSDLLRIMLTAVTDKSRLLPHYRDIGDVL
jgi:hypothetical protein